MKGFITDCWPRDDGAFFSIVISGTVELFLILYAIFFLQSGIEKIIHRKGKLGYLMVHYEHTSFVKMAPNALTFFTIIELIVGGMAILSQFAVALQIYRFRFMPINTALSACFVLLGLYISQRKGQNLEGARKTRRYLFFAVLGLIVIWGSFFNYSALYPFI